MLIDLFDGVARLHHLVIRWCGQIKRPLTSLRHDEAIFIDHRQGPGRALRTEPTLPCRPPRVRLNELVLDARHELSHRAAQSGRDGNPCLHFECWVHLQKSEIDHAAGTVTEGLANEEALVHAFEETAPFGLAYFGESTGLLNVGDVVGMPTKRRAATPTVDTTLPRYPADLSH
jgi:hypothetical protein